MKIGGRLRVSGAVRAAGEIELTALPQHTRAVSYLCGRSGPRHHTFAGPLLLDAVIAADPVFLPGDRKERLRYLLALDGADGHGTVLSWGEIDPEFGNAPVMLGLSRDGRDLAGEGPHLVVPGDRCGARNISRLAGLHIYLAIRP
jgi:hypothetical protein